MTGTATGAGASGAGYFPAVSRWSVVFRRVKGPKKEVGGSVGASDLNTLDASQLVIELRRALRAGRG